MKKNMDIKKPGTINPEGWYSVAEIHDNNFLPMLSSKYLIKKWILIGKLKGIHTSKGLSHRFSVKGVNIITFKAKFEAGDYHN